MKSEINRDKFRTAEKRELDLKDNRTLKRILHAKIRAICFYHDHTWNESFSYL